MPLKVREQQHVSVFLSGAVQGIGFRPFVFRLAQELGLTGFVRNSTNGVIIEAEGSPQKVAAFLKRIPEEKPPLSFIQNYQYTLLDPIGFSNFVIRESDEGSLKSAVVLPDIAICPQCLAEIFDPQNRRYLYPFTNCTQCGPRFSIVEALPYDRVNTSMKKFRMCPDCAEEYNNPDDRRFHAQPNACPKCGPHLELWDAKGKVIATRREAVSQAVDNIKKGKIAAVKGIGGFHLFADAHNEKSVQLLRKRKHREEKPFALMFPTLKSIEAQCRVSPQERALLLSGESPIVLLIKKRKIGRLKAVANSVAPGNPSLGAMLPYSPLHHILMKELGRAVVATSANLAEEPICADEKEALQRLGGIADVFLVHDRPIVRSIDDSVVRVVMNRPLVIRRARGYAPLPVTVRTEGPSVLAVGGHLKNTVALNVKGNVFICQHIGDLQTEQSLQAFRRAAMNLQGLYATSPAYIACDMHPDYLSTKFAKDSKLPLIKVQHHHAHIVSCMAENRLDGTVLGISWDGTGYGPDGTVWGGEFLKSTLTDYERVAHLKSFMLPGGDKAAMEPRRVAAAILYELAEGDWKEFKDLAPIKSFTSKERKVIKDMMCKKVNAPVTTSMGRLFDAVASLMDIKQVLRFEGQAAMGLEYILEGARTDSAYDYAVDRNPDGGYILNWTTTVQGIIKDVRKKMAAPKISAKFHNTLVEMALDIAKRVGEKRIVLSGGCFQNKYLTERMVRRLNEEGFKPYWHQLVPPNDGGISLGQAVCAINRIK